jgi:hypothetical protein
LSFVVLSITKNAAMKDQQRFTKNLNALNSGLSSKLKLGKRRTATDNLRKARHRLPRHLRREADKILRVEESLSHPKLARLANTASVKGSFKTISTHLKAIDPAEERKSARLGMAGSIVFNVLVVVVLFLIVLAWQGLL